MRDVFREAKQMVDLRTVMQVEGAKEYSNYVAGICPFHDDNQPSILIYADGWHCTATSCPKSSGSVIDWIAHQRGLVAPSGRDLYQIAKELVGDKISLPRARFKRRKKKPPPKKLPLTLGQAQSFYHMLDEDAWSYYHGRGFETWFVILNMWGWCADVAVIPIWSGIPRQSEVLTLRFRALNPGSGAPRYWGLPDRNEAMLYNSWVVDYAIRNELPRIYVFYGEFDSAIALQNGYPAVSPTNGCKAFNTDWVEGYEGEIIFVPDLGEEDAAFKDANEVGLMGDVLSLPYKRFHYGAMYGMYGDQEGKGPKDFNDLYLLNRKEALKCLSGKPDMSLVSQMTGA